MEFIEDDKIVAIDVTSENVDSNNDKTDNILSSCETDPNVISDKIFDNNSNNDLVEITIDNEKKYLSYSEVKNILKPFDLIQFKGTEIVSGLIGYLESKTLGYGEFTHCGIIVTSDILPNITELKKDRIYVFESIMSHSLLGITDGVPDVITGTGKFGCQIRDFEDVLKGYMSKDGALIALCSLINNPWDNLEKRSELIKKMQNVYHTYGSRMYDVNILSLGGAIFPRVRPIQNFFNKLFSISRSIRKKICPCCFNQDKPDDGGILGWVFCSELVAHVYQVLGIISSDKNPAHFVPVDFMGYDKDGCPKIVNDPIYIIPDKDA
jgi:hypothetical protein